MHLKRFNNFSIAYGVVVTPERAFIIQLHFS